MISAKDQSRNRDAQMYYLDATELGAQIRMIHMQSLHLESGGAVVTISITGILQVTCLVVQWNYLQKHLL